MSTTINPVNAGTFLAGNVLRFIPEPKSSTAVSFKSVMDGLQKVVTTAADVGDGVAGRLDPSYQDLLEKQIEVQKQMLVLSMLSNVEKSKHETQMAPVRNIRVG